MIEQVRKAHPFVRLACASARGGCNYWSSIKSGLDDQDGGFVVEILQIFRVSLSGNNYKGCNLKSSIAHLNYLVQFLDRVPAGARPRVAHLGARDIGTRCT